jgi:hypothetical protein
MKGRLLNAITKIACAFFILGIFYDGISLAQAVAPVSPADSTEALDTALYIPLWQFTYANDRRYTIDGKLPFRKTKIKPVETAIVGSVFATTVIALHINQANAWWSGQRRSFHVVEDWQSALQVDKCGHTFGSYLMSYGFSESLIASGFSWDDAVLYGSALGLLYQTYVETEDGFASDWGFSPTDWYADAFGAMFFLAQHYVPALQNVTPKWQFAPSEWTGKPVINRPRTFIDDYNSSTFWWSVDVYNILPKDSKKYWPKWLNIAVGYGGDAIDAVTDPGQPPDQLGMRRYVVGLDLNLVRLLPEGPSFWNWFRQTLNFIKFPLPSIEFSKAGTRFYLFYPFKIEMGSLKF